MDIGLYSYSLTSDVVQIQSFIVMILQDNQVERKEDKHIGCCNHCCDQKFNVRIKVQVKYMSEQTICLCL